MKMKTMHRNRTNYISKRERKKEDIVICDNYVSFILVSRALIDRNV